MRSNKLLLLAGLATLLIALAWLLTSDRAQSPTASTPAPGARRNDSLAATLASPERTAPPETSAEPLPNAAEVPVAAPSSTHEPQAPPPVVSLDADLTLAVKDQRGRPQLDPEPTVLIAYSDSARERLRSLAAEFEAFAAIGVRDELPEDQVTRSPRWVRPATPHGATALAWSGEGSWRGLLELEPGAEGPREIQLTTELWIAVEVVDLNGATPQGVRVNLKALPDNSERWRWLDSNVSGDDGPILISLPLTPQAALDDQKTWGPLELVTRPMHAEEVSENVQLLDFELHRTITLTHPAVGSLVVECFEADGRPSSTPVLLNLSDAGVPELSSGWILEPGEAHRSGSIPLGLVFDLRTIRYDHSIDHSEALEATEPLRISGPSASQAEVHIRVDLPPPLATVAGVLLDPQRQPLADTPIQLSLHQSTDSGATRSVDLLTDSSGRFELHLNLAGSIPALHRIVFRTTGSLDLRGSCSVPWAAGIPPSGSTELGTLALHPARKILAGTVVDTRATPIAGVTVFAQPLHTREGIEQPFRDELQPVSMTDDFGRFEIFAAEPDGTYRVQAHVRGFERMVRLEHVELDTLDLVIELPDLDPKESVK